MANRVGVVATRPSLLLPLAVAILVVSLMADLRVLPSDPARGQDFNDFYAAAMAQRQGLNPYQSGVVASMEHRLFGRASFSDTVASPPAFFLAFRPLTLLTPAQGYVLWTGVSLAAMILSLLALGTLLGIAADPRLWVLVCSPPVVIALFLGQISLLLTACFLWSVRCALRGRYRAAGVLLALTLVKPHLMVVPALLLCGLTWKGGGRRMAMTALVSVLVITMLAIPFTEAGALPHWVAALFTYGKNFDQWQPDLSTLAGVYLPLVPRLAGRVLSVIVILAGLGAATLLIRVRGQGVQAGTARWWRVLALGCACWLLVMPYLHPYDDVLLLLPLAVLLAGRQGLGLGQRLGRDATLALATMLTVPELDLLGFRPNLSFSYTVLPVFLCVVLLWYRPDQPADGDREAA